MLTGEVKDVKRIPKQFYDLVFSIGEACSCASALNRAGLRQFSGPWDWCVGGTFEHRIEMICTGFEGFLDKNSLTLVGTRAQPEPCNIYQNTQTGVYFNHDFPLGVDLDTSFPEVLEKYQRRAQRLEQHILQSNRVLAVFMELPDPINHAKQDDQLIEAARALNTRFPLTRIDILYLRHDAGIKGKTVLYKCVNQNVTVARLCISQQLHDDPLAISKRNVMKAISYINTNGKRLALIRRKLFKLPARGEKTHFTLLGIKFKLRSHI